MVAKKRVASWVVTDDFWARVEPLTPVRARPPDLQYARKGRRWSQTQSGATGLRRHRVCVANGLPVEGAAQGALWQRQRDPQAVSPMGECWRIRGDLGCGVGRVRQHGGDRLALAEY